MPAKREEISKATRTRAMKLIGLAIEQAKAGERDPVIVAAVNLGIEFNSQVWNLAFSARVAARDDVRRAESRERDVNARIRPLTHLRVLRRAYTKLRKGWTP